MKIKVILVFMILALSSFSFGEDTIWNYSKEMNADSNYKFNTFELDQDVYKNAKYDLSDLRVIDESDCYVPFYIVKNKWKGKINDKSISFNRIGKYPYKDHMFYEFLSEKDVLEESPLIDELILQIDSPRDYFQYIDVYGSFDSEHWDRIQTDSIYKIDKSEDSRIELNKTLKYPYYRLVVLEEQSNIDIKSVDGAFTKTEILSASKEEELFISDYTQSEMENVTELKIDNIENMPLVKLMLEIEGMYKRPVEVWLGKKDKTQVHITNTYIYQSVINEKNVNREIELNINQNYEYIVIKIYNGSNSPLTINNIKALIRNPYIVIETESEKKYQLIYGNENAHKPVYDIESFKDEIERSAKGKGILGSKNKIEFDGSFNNCTGTKTSSDSYNLFSQKMLFDGLIILVSLVLLWILMKSMKKTK